MNIYKKGSKYYCNNWYRYFAKGCVYEIYYQKHLWVWCAWQDGGWGICRRKFNKSEFKKLVNNGILEKLSEDELMIKDIIE